MVTSQLEQSNEHRYAELRRQVRMWFEDIHRLGLSPSEAEEVERAAQRATTIIDCCHRAGSMSCEEFIMPAMPAWTERGESIAVPTPQRARANIDEALQGLHDLQRQIVEAHQEHMLNEISSDPEDAYFADGIHDHINDAMAYMIGPNALCVIEQVRDPSQARMTPPQVRITGFDESHREQAEQAEQVLSYQMANSFGIPEPNTARVPPYRLHQWQTDSLAPQQLQSVEQRTAIEALNTDFSASNPPTWRRLRDLIEHHDFTPQAVAGVMMSFGMSPDSTITGRFEGTSQLRTDDDETDDTMGEETDDCIGMGEAETWFREKTSDVG
jgi:hypothetical protein